MMKIPTLLGVVFLTIATLFLAQGANAETSTNVTTNGVSNTNTGTFTDFLNAGLEKKKSGDLDGAIAAYDQAIKLNPKAAFAYLSRGIAKTEKKDLDGAINDFNMAIELKPSFAPTYSYRGIAKKAKGDLAGANADFEHGRELKGASSPVPSSSPAAATKTTVSP